MSIIKSRIPFLPGRLAALTQISETTHDLPTSIRRQFSWPALLLEVICSAALLLLPCNKMCDLARSGVGGMDAVSLPSGWVQWAGCPSVLSLLTNVHTALLHYHRSAKRMMASLPPSPPIF